MCFHRKKSYIIGFDVELMEMVKILEVDSNSFNLTPNDTKLVLKFSSFKCLQHIQKSQQPNIF
jgi:hypothetical protein